MILRRIVENVRARDWFTVTIEFLIVVVGIFVGLQAQIPLRDRLISGWSSRTSTPRSIRAT